MGGFHFSKLSLWFLVCVLKSGCLHHQSQIPITSEGLLFLLRKKYKYRKPTDHLPVDFGKCTSRISSGSLAVVSTTTSRISH